MTKQNGSEDNAVEQGDQGAGGESAVAEAAAGFDAATGAPPAEPTAEQLVTQLQAELEAERSRIAAETDKFQRTVAEFQNARRRQERQTNEAIERASTHIIKRMLPILDDLELAFDALPAALSEDQASWVEGFRQVKRKMLALLEEENVTALPTVGPFDPTRHEAVSSEPNDSVESEHIISTLRVGYEHRGQVLRPALVRVAA